MIRHTLRRAALATATLALGACAALPPAGNDWTPLYDHGVNLNDWTQVGDANWRIQGRMLAADLLRGTAPAYLVSKKTFRDFEIHAEFWVDAQTNSGIFIRCADPAKIDAERCYEVNIWDTRPDPSYGTGAIVNVAKVSPMPTAGGRWSTMRITARGERLTVTLNGQVSVDVSDRRLSAGHVALQYGSGTLRFRRVLIRPL
jgi:hypothetical protein